MVIFEKDNLSRSFIEIVFQNRGSIYAKKGVAYFCAHLLNTKGTLTKKEKFYQKLEEDAIELNVSVNREFFTISLKFLNSKEKSAINALKELLLNPNFSQESFEKSKKEIYAKIENKKNDNDYIASTNLFKTIFKNTPLEYPVLYLDEEISLKDINEFFNTLSKESAIFINGGKKIDLSSIKEILPSQKMPKTLFFKPQQNDYKETKKTEQSYIYFTSPFDVDYQKELHLAKIATFILGSGGFGSRIMEEIRVKRGYAYSAYAHNSFKKSYKLLSGYMQTKIENTEDSIKLLKEIINEFWKNGVKEEELTSAKKFLIGSEPLRNETLAQRLLKKFNEIYLNLPKNYYSNELEKIKNTSLDELNHFIKSHPEIKDISFSILTNGN